MVPRSTSLLKYMVVNKISGLNTTLGPRKYFLSNSFRIIDFKCHALEEI